MSPGGIVIEAVRTPSIAQVVFVSGPVPLVCAPLGYQLYLGAGRSIEIGRLVIRSYPEFFNTVRRRRHYTGGTSATRGTAHTSRGLYSDQAAGRVACETGGIGVLGAVHVAGVIAAIQHEGVLVLVGAGDAAVDRHARLQSYEGADIAPEAWEVVQREACQGVADGGRRGLHSGARGKDLNGFGSGTNFEFEVQRECRAYRELLPGDLCHAKSGLADGDVVLRGGHVSENVMPGVVSGSSSGGARIGIGERN